MITINLWFITVLGLAFVCFGLGRAFEAKWKTNTGAIEFIIGVIIIAISIILR